MSHRTSGARALRVRFAPTGTTKIRSMHRGVRLRGVESPACSCRGHDEGPPAWSTPSPARFPCPAITSDVTAADPPGEETGRMRPPAADRADDPDRPRAPPGTRRTTPVIPKHRNRRTTSRHDKQRHRHRRRIDTMFRRLKVARRVATRYDTRPASGSIAPPFGSPPSPRSGSEWVGTRGRVERQTPTMAITPAISSPSSSWRRPRGSRRGTRLPRPSLRLVEGRGKSFSPP